VSVAASLAVSSCRSAYRGVAEEIGGADVASHTVAGVVGGKVHALAALHMLKHLKRAYIISLT
jgi:hypothetical protein